MEHNKAAKTKTEKTAQPEPKLRMRNQMAVIHHLFKAELGKFLKDLTSWKLGQPSLTHVEHVHFFHTVSSQGVAQRFTNAVGGHFHEVTWGVDAEGNLQAKCGPPLKKVGRPGPNGTTRFENIPIKFHDKVGSVEGKPNTDYVDTHTHVMTYLGSDELSPAKVSAAQAAQRSQLQDGLETARKTLSDNGVSISD